MNFRKIVVGLLISVFLPLLLQRMLVFEQKHIDADGTATVSLWSFSLSPLGYILAIVCLFLVYLVLIYLWSVRKKKKEKR